MRLLILSLAVSACGYDGSLGRLAEDVKKTEETVDDIDSEPDKPAERSESDSEATESNESSTMDPTPNEPRKRVSEPQADNSEILLTADDFGEHCADFELDGDFQVAVEIDKQFVEFTVYFTDSDCQNATIRYDSGVIEGGVCDNGQEFMMFFEGEAQKAKRLRITRKNHEIHWEYSTGREYKRLQYIGIKQDWENTPTFCRQAY